MYSGSFGDVVVQALMIHTPLVMSSIERSGILETLHNALHDGTKISQSA